MSDDGLLMWQRIAQQRGEPIDIPPRQRRQAAQTTGTEVSAEIVDERLVEHRLDLPWDRPPLNHNHRLNHWAKGALVAEVRRTLFILARQAKVGRHDRITVQLHYAPGRRGRQDPMNWTATSKPAIDGLVDAGVVNDDDTEHVHELTPEIHFPPEPGPRCWLTIRAGDTVPVPQQKDDT